MYSELIRLLTVRPSDSGLRSAFGYLRSSGAQQMRSLLSGLGSSAFKDISEYLKENNDLALFLSRVSPFAGARESSGTVCDINNRMRLAISGVLSNCVCVYVVQTQEGAEASLCTASESILRSLSREGHLTKNSKSRLGYYLSELRSERDKEGQEYAVVKMSINSASDDIVRIELDMIYNLEIGASANVLTVPFFVYYGVISALANFVMDATKVSRVVCVEMLCKTSYLTYLGGCVHEIITDDSTVDGISTAAVELNLSSMKIETCNRDRADEVGFRLDAVVGIKVLRLIDVLERYQEHDMAGVE